MSEAVFNVLFGLGFTVLLLGGFVVYLLIQECKLNRWLRHWQDESFKWEMEAKRTHVERDRLLSKYNRIQAIIKEPDQDTQFAPDSPPTV